MEKDILPDTTSVSKIEDGLYLGNLTAALDISKLKELHISHILTIDSKPLPQDILDIPGLFFLYIEVDDMPSKDLISRFEEITNFIADGQEKGNVLVHCYFGVSRSACAVVAFLMKKYSLKMDDALQRVKLKRKFVCPNSGFLSQLVLYENLKYDVTIDNHLYRLYRLTVAGNAFKNGNFRDTVPDVIFNRDVISKQKSSFSVKCKICRTFLLNDVCVIPHEKGVAPKWFNPEYRFIKERCPLGIFSAPLDWMANLKNPQGKLHCPKCLQKLGSFNWIKGTLCPCQVTISPGFLFVPSKIDVCL